MILIIRGEHKYDEGDREEYKKKGEILIYLVRGRNSEGIIRKSFVTYAEDGSCW